MTHSLAMVARHWRAALFSLFALLIHAPDAQAGVAYRMNLPQAVAGQTINFSSIVFNDTDSAMRYVAPDHIVIQWRTGNEQIQSTTAYRESSNKSVNIPVNSFVRYAWRTTVPADATGATMASVGDGSNAMGLFVLAAGSANIGNGMAGTAPQAAAQYATTDQNMPTAHLASAAPTAPRTTTELAAPTPSIELATAPADSTGQASSTVQGTGLKTPPSAFDNFRSAISAFEPVYFDLGSKGDTNARFQLSFKYRLFNPKDPQHPDFIDNLYLGYTQTSLWDLQGDSMPFIDTTYNPSAFWHKGKLWQPASQNWFAGLTTGVEHKSNGKSGDDSRSLNDVFIEPAFNYRFDGGSTLTFAPRVKAYFLDNQNPDYVDYMGRVDWKLRWAQDNGLVLSGLYQQGHHGRHAVQLDAAWPLQRTFLHMNGYLHVQYYEGYGETLLGYKEKVDPQVRIGLSLVP